MLLGVGKFGAKWVGKFERNIHYNDYTQTGAPTMTGIYVTGGQKLYINTGNMTNMNRGLEITPSSTQCVEMDHVTCSALTGVYADQAKYSLYIHDCTIRTTETAIDIKNHLTSSVSPSVSCDGNINIVRNRITSLTETGVRIKTTSGDGAINVQDNTVGTEILSVGGILYYGIEIYQVPKSVVSVERNQVVNVGNTQPSIPGGIYLYSCKRMSTIADNTVMSGIYIYGDFQFGIMAVNTPHCLVRGNTVDGGSNTMDLGISIENPMDDITLCCNYMDHATRGLNIMGPHENCTIQTSIFNNHSEALYYDMVVSTSAFQYHNGNNWSSAGTTYDAYYNGSPSFVSTLKYQVDPALLPALLTKVFVTGGSASSWFSTPVGTEQACDADCGDGFTDGGGEEGLTENDYWAMNGLEDESYAALQWEAQRHLYEKMVNYPALLQDAQAAAFYSAAQEGNLGKFYAIETGMANLYDPALTADPVQALADLQALNASISPEADYQDYAKTINTLQLSALAQDDLVFSDEERSTIDQVAALCPQAGGNAVYDARLLQENYRIPDWNMDCAFVGTRSDAKSVQPTGWKVFPNPATDLVQVSLPQPASTDYQAAVFNLTGQLLYTQKIDAGITNFVLPASALQNGVYLLRVSGNSRLLDQQKFSILH